MLQDRDRRLSELREKIVIGMEEAERGHIAPLDMRAILAEALRRVDMKRKRDLPSLFEDGSGNPAHD